MNFCKKQVRNCDWTAQSVDFSYRGKRTQGTTVGGICSLILAFTIVYYFLVSIVKIVNEPNLTSKENKVFQNVLATKPSLNNTDNNQTFPAVTVVFKVPKTVTDDPWEYINKQYVFTFVDNGVRSYGVPCDEVEGYANSTIEDANLKRETFFGEYGDKGLKTVY